MSRQYVRCWFHAGDRRTYTYHHDGEPLAKGDRVVVATPRGERTVEVEGISDRKPAFETKAIVRKYVEPGKLL